MEIITILLLVLLGIVLLFVEFMLIPGITIAGVGCVISFGTAIFLAFKYYGSMAGFITLGAILIFVPVFLYFFFKGKAAKSMMLKSDIDGVVKTVDEQKIHPGDQGVTISRCTPGGNARFNGSTVEVRSMGVFIDPHTPVEVVKIEGNIVIVKPIK
jgi:membrane-bound ClpP family serine protease